VAGSQLVRSPSVAPPWAPPSPPPRVPGSQLVRSPSVAPPWVPPLAPPSGSPLRLYQGLTFLASLPALPLPRASYACRRSSPEEISRCVVTGGAGVGWTVVEKLSEALELAHMRSYVRNEAQGAIFGGASVRLCGLQGRPELNGECGIALRFVDESGRWLVRLKDGEGKSLKPSNLEPLGAGHGVVHCVWGDAQWSRTQLLGEIARGHWGLCRTSVAELIATPTARWDSLDGRLVFAPDTEMMEDFIRHGGSSASAVAAMEREGALNARSAGALSTRRSDSEEGGDEGAAGADAAEEAEGEVPSASDDADGSPVALG
jgi:hypothetical protein